MILREHKSAAAVFFCTIQRPVRRFIQLIERRVRFSDRRTHGDPGAAVRAPQRNTHLVENLLRPFQNDRFRRIRGEKKRRRELVAAHAAGPVLCFQGYMQRLRHQDQELVSVMMAEGVVILLEFAPLLAQQKALD